MPALARYYLGRVLRRGDLSSENIALAMRESATIEYRGTRYSFIDYQEFGSQYEKGYYAKLAKYKQRGAVEVVREEQHASAEAAIRNLIDAASPFVYLPAFSGIAYRHIWNSFPKNRFEKVFKQLVESKFDKFFVGCDVEPVTDLRTFVMRLSKLDSITELDAKVLPPNPLFGPAWRSLGEYVKKRRLEEFQIKEEAQAGIRTKLKEIAAAVLADRSSQEMAVLMEPLMGGVGDAALLMAADGYGRAKVRGKEQDRDVVIRTSENQKSFMFDPEPDPGSLVEQARSAFARVSEEQGLKHQ
jgi:hypothetical protein